MWMILPALSLVLVHIAGGNAGIAPDSAAAGGGIYSAIILAYIVLGSLLTAVSAWIGARSRCELGVLVGKIFGCRGKKLLALIILSVSLPASALTGGYFAAMLLHFLTGIPQTAGIVLCLGLFVFLAAGYGPELLAASNYISLLLIPALALMILQLGGRFLTGGFAPGPVDWPLVLALLGYNAGGMRSAMAAEAAAHLARNGCRAIWPTVAAKLAEGLLTLAMAQIVLVAGSKGALALRTAADTILGPGGGWLFSLILFCTFANTMAPAMTVNARQISCLTGTSLWPSLGLGAVAVYAASFLAYECLLFILAVTGVGMTAFIAVTAFFLHKYGPGQQ